MAPVEQDTVPLSAGLAALETVVVVVVAREVSSDHWEVPALRTYSGSLDELGYQAVMLTGSLAAGRENGMVIH